MDKYNRKGYLHWRPYFIANSKLSIYKDNKEFNVINKQDKTNKEILRIKLKAKDNANIGNTEITIDGIVASDGKTEFENEKLTQ